MHQIIPSNTQNGFSNVKAQYFFKINILEKSTPKKPQEVVEEMSEKNKMDAKLRDSHSILDY